MIKTLCVYTELTAFSMQELNLLFPTYLSTRCALDDTQPNLTFLKIKRKRRQLREIGFIVTANLSQHIQTAWNTLIISEKTDTWFSIRVWSAHRRSWRLSVGQCGCAAAVWCGGPLCPGPPVPRPRPDRTPASATAKSRAPRARLEGGQKATLTWDTEVVFVNTTQG